LEEVIVVFNTHFDIGYTDFAESVVRKYGSSLIEGALYNLEASMEIPQKERFNSNCQFHHLSENRLNNKF